MDAGSKMEQKVNKMKLQEKEKIQRNEARLTKEMDSLEQLLRTPIQDHQTIIKKKKEAVENVRDIIKDYEAQLDKKSKIKKDLWQKMANLNDSSVVHKKIHIAMGKASNEPKSIPMNGVPIKQTKNLREQRALQSQQIKQMQQNQEGKPGKLRGQIHFLDAKVKQRAKLLESPLQATSPPHSDTDISSPSQESPLQMPCEMSPRSLHSMEIQQLEEKIGRLAHVNEELVRRNRELEGQAKKLKGQLSELQQENDFLQERLSEELVQISVLHLHLEEKHRGCSTPQKSILQAALRKEVENKDLLAKLWSEDLKKSCKISAELEKENNKLKTEVESLNKELKLVNKQLTKAKDQVENEQAQVETLREEMANLLSQNSMQLEVLSKEVEREKAILTQMEMNFVGSKRNFDLQIDHFKAKFENLKNLHITEVTDLRMRIKTLSNKKTGKRQEDIDISEVHRQILVASSVFGADDSECYRNLVYELVKKAIDAKINQMAKKHEDSINEINETWEAKMKSELNKNNQFEKRCEKLKENLLLLEKCAEHSQRLSLEKDIHWQAKLKGIKNFAKLEVKTKYENEIANLKLSLDNASKERSSAEAKFSTLSQQVNDLKKKFQGQKNEMVTEFKNKLSLLEKKLQDRRDAEMAQQQVIERLREDLQYQLQREKNLVERHREEVANLHKFFEAKLVDEIKKIQVSQMEEFRKLKDTKEKNIEALCNNLYAQYEERLKSIQEEYAKKLAEEQAKTEKRIEEGCRREVENLQRDFEEKLHVEEGKRMRLRLTYLRQLEKVKEMMRDQ